MRTVRQHGPWRRAWLTGLTTWGVAYATYLMLNAVYWTVASVSPPPLGGFFTVWNRWDTEHYINIATHGYDVTTENPAFFPLYPLLMAAVDPVLPGRMLAAALVISALACIAALAMIHRLVEDIFDTSTAQRTAVYLMASPFAFFLVAAYNESLLVALCVASLYCMRRGHWWAAGALGGLASAARQAGVLLMLAFAVEYARQRGWFDVARRRPRRLGWDALAVLLVPTGLFAFIGYSAVALDDPLKFLHIQTFWGRQLSPPWLGTIEAINHVGFWATETLLHSLVVLNVIDLAAVAVLITLLGLSLFGPWRLGPPAWYLITFGSAVLLMVLLTPIGRGLPPLHGLPRYALEMLPVFVVLARIGANRIADRAYLFPAIALQAALVIAFFNGVWLS